MRTALTKLSGEYDMQSIAKLKNYQYEEQAGRCYYCHQPMWQHDVEQFAQLHGVSKRMARLLQATAEHLVPRSDGGNNKAENVVAACLFCNKTRHKAKIALPPERYRERVARRLAKGQWHRLFLSR